MSLPPSPLHVPSNIELMVVCGGGGYLPMGVMVVGGGG